MLAAPAAMVFYAMHEKVCIDLSDAQKLEKCSKIDLFKISRNHNDEIAKSHQYEYHELS